MAPKSKHVFIFYLCFRTRYSDLERISSFCSNIDSKSSNNTYLNIIKIIFLLFDRQWFYAFFSSKVGLFFWIFRSLPLKLSLFFMMGQGLFIKYSSFNSTIGATISTTLINLCSKSFQASWTSDALLDQSTMASSLINFVLL